MNSWLLIGGKKQREGFNKPLALLCPKRLVFYPFCIEPNRHSGYIRSDQRDARNFRILTQPETTKNKTSNSCVEIYPLSCSFTALKTSNAHIHSTNKRNLALPCLHFANNNRRTSFLKTGVPQEMAHFLEDHLFPLSRSNWTLPIDLSYNYWQSSNKPNRSLELSIHLRR